MTSGDTSGIRATFDMVINRNFVAAVDEVWKAWTEGDYLREWWGATGFTAPVAEMDVREGGMPLVAMRAPDDMGGFEHSTPGPTGRSCQRAFGVRPTLRRPRRKADRSRIGGHA